MALLRWQTRGPAKAVSPITGQPGRAQNVAAVLLGSRLLNKMLGQRQLTLVTLPGELLAQLLARHGAVTPDDLYEAVGTGKVPASTVVTYLLDGREGQPARQLRCSPQ